MFERISALFNLNDFLGQLRAVKLKGTTDCPPLVQIAHNKDCSSSREVNEHCFNHDNEDRPRHLEAFNAALYQTQHEWCRLLHLLQSAHGFEGVSIPLALWTTFDDHPQRSPHPLATPCERDFRGGPVEVNVTIDSLELTRNADFPVLSFVVYRGDLRDSDRKLSTGTQSAGVELPRRRQPKRNECAAGGERDEGCTGGSPLRRL